MNSLSSGLLGCGERADVLQQDEMQPAVLKTMQRDSRETQLMVLKETGFTSMGVMLTITNGIAAL